MDADATRALIEELLDAYNAPDLDRAALLYAEDCEYVNRALGIRIEGRDAQRTNMQAFLDAFPDRKLRPRRVIADERGAAVEAGFVATSPGGPGMPPAGQSYSVEVKELEEEERELEAAIDVAASSPTDFEEHIQTLEEHFRTTWTPATLA